METEVNEQMERSQEDLQELKKNLETLRADLAVLLNTLREAAKGQMIQAKHRLWASSKTLEGEAQSRMEHAYELLKERGELARAKTIETVEHRPLTTLFGAFAAGFFVASFLRRS